MICELCGEPMPEGETMFKYHGYSGPCPKPPLQRAALAAQPNEPVAWTESYVQQVPDKCDRIVWRNRYYSLPPAPAAVPLSDDRILGLFRQAFVACADPMGKNNMTIAFARAIERAHGIGDKT
jgi:hypothetical protein